MARRSWRNFDYLLLGTLLILAALGATMIYSATINTLGLEDALRRQLIFIGAGIAILLVTASIDYRLLEIAQHPIAVLTPFALSLGAVAATVVWQTQQLPALQDTIAATAFAPDLPALLIGIVLLILVFLADRAWLEDLDLALTRSGAVLFVVITVGVVAVLISRMGPEKLATLAPYLLGAGLAVLYLLDCLTLRITDILRNPIYVVMLALLGIVFVVGQVSGGSQRWLGTGMIQPSELSKILVVIALAKFLADREEQMEQFGTVLASLGVIGVPMLLIYLQPDLGTALTFVAIWIAMMWMAGMRFRHLLLLFGLGVAVLPLLWLSLEDYMRDRLLLFINPEGNPDDYFNVHQALVSIGSGGWTGKGLTHGTQSQLHFLRVRHTDFIFAVTAEELGFLGAVVLIGLILFILWRMLRVAEHSRDTFGRLIAAGVVAVILFQSVVNIGMNLGLMPVTGIPLPFVSYGGSSFLTLMLGMGLVESVAMRHKKLEFD
jgi:rod shape determining protein RodA